MSHVCQPWNVAWLTYGGPVFAVLSGGEIISGEATDRRLGPGVPLIRVSQPESGREVWLHPRYVWPRWKPPES
ncbi:MAG: hypothetical protein ACE366_16635 [Bradymonadia bacterium]